ncbi:flavodoxin family protein, partial [Salmonella enterica subsp. enterica serovar Dublin]|nr:flavodoxin family protein [Salmonella enterica subsp. enterica serovar Dublin]EGN5930219.1 flavodoxin family protein [Salmonella enterica subsp. enterica serovar Dublin]
QKAASSLTLQQCPNSNYFPRFYVSTSKSIIKALINMHSFEIQLSPIG